MKEYSSNSIKNIALVGQAGSGKTSLVEGLLYKNGASDRLGKISEGNTVTDFDAEEIKRRASLGLALAPFEYNGVKLNLIDAPGLFDFEGGLYEALTACDTALITLSGKSGVAVGTRKAYALATTLNKAKMFFVSKMDNENADFYKVLEGLKTSFGPSVCPIIVPFYNDKTVECYINLIDMKAYSYDKGKATEIPMPDTEHRLDGLITAISEAVAETNDELFEKYFSGEAFSHDELVKGIHDGIKANTITPVLCGSAYTLDGIDMVTECLATMLPSANEVENVAVAADDSMVTLECDQNKPLVAQVFKTFADPFVGKLSLVKVYSGKITSNTVATNMTTGEDEKIGKMISLKGKKQEDVQVANAGDIVALTKLSAKTGDTLCSGIKVTIPKISYPTPCYALAIVPKGKGDESKISAAVARLLEEDLTLSYTNNVETHQQVITGLGEQHLDVVVSKLKSKFGIDIDTAPVLVAYRETIRKTADVEGKHKKQSGGHGQYGHVKIIFEPFDCPDLVFEQKVVGGTVPKNYHPAVEKGLRESITRGVIAGYPVVGVKATLYDGSYHDVDSSEAAFKMAANIAYKNGMAAASPVLLEPVGKLMVTVPDENTGDMMGELNKLRGRVLGMTPQGNGETQIEAEVPMSETSDFATLVRQMTRGAGSFTMEFARYEMLPSQLEAGVIQKAKALFSKEE